MFCLELYIFHREKKDYNGILTFKIGLKNLNKNYDKKIENWVKVFFL